MSKGCGVSKDAKSKMYKECTLIMEVWTIWRPPEAVEKIKGCLKKKIIYYTVGVSKDAKSKVYYKYSINIGGLDHFEATRGCF